MFWGAAVQDKGWPGAKIYDALLLACAARAGAEVRLNRVHRALTRLVKAVMGNKPGKVKAWPAVGSVQLRFLGSTTLSLTGA